MWWGRSEFSRKRWLRLPGNMTFHGPVSRDGAALWYRQSDVFVLPTLSDGFALTQLEALAHGLPVIVTPNCGRVVREGKTGFIIPPRDPQALADAILRFVHHPSLAQEMAPFCRQAVKAYSVDAYGKRLVEIIQKHFGAPVPEPWSVRSDFLESDGAADFGWQRFQGNPSPHA